MADKSAIEWTDATWNPIVGCSIVSPGCTNCYAMKMAARIERMGPASVEKSEARLGRHPGAHYAGTTKGTKAGAVWTGKVALAPDHILTQPLRWKRGRSIFVNSMGDLFHESIPDEWIDRVFAVMALCPRHTFQVLTKRAERMQRYMSSGIYRRLFKRVDLINDLLKSSGALPQPERLLFEGPLKHIWLGVSTERQQEADERIPLLLQTPAAVRFISAEPLLGPVDLNAHLPHPIEPPTWPKLHWVIVGGESGPGARPMHPQWARSLRDQCAAAGVPFFFKQWGEWRQRDCVHVSREHAVFNTDGSCEVNVGVGTAVDALRTHVVVERMGKKAAGRLLDGREHNEFPEART